MTEKRFEFRRFYVDIANINEIALYEIDNNPSDDLDDSNLFYVYSTTDADVQAIVDKLNRQNRLLNKQDNQIQEYKHLVKIATGLIEWNTIPQVRREWKKHLSKVSNVLNEQEETIEELEKENNMLKEQLQNIQELFDNTIRSNEDAIEWGKNMGADVSAMSFHNEMLKQMQGDVN